MVILIVINLFMCCIRNLLQLSSKSKEKDCAHRKANRELLSFCCNLHKINMASGDSTRLTSRQIARLAFSIPEDIFESVANQYLGLTHAQIKNIKADYHTSVEGAKREILRNWARKTPGNQIEVSYFYHIYFVKKKYFDCKYSHNVSNADIIDSRLICEK